MKRRIKFQVFILLLGLISCDEGLDIKTDDSYGDNLTWSLPEKAEGILNNAYNAIMRQPDLWAGNNFLDVATDNAVTNDFASGLYTLTAGGMTAQNNPIEGWKTAYEQFQYINLFLENGLGSNIIYNLLDSTIDASRRTRLKGEAYFLRAWWGFDLLQKYGGLTNDGVALGYPIVLNSLQYSELSLVNNMKRNTYEECVAQIASDCDSAIMYRSLNVDEADYTIRGAGKSAYALKSRLYTYAASPAYQSVGTTESERINKWIRAAQVSVDAITKGLLGNYTGLVEANLSGTSLRNSTPNEFLFRYRSDNNNMEKRNFPSSFFGEGKTNPSQNLIDAFPMLNGYPIYDSRSGYNPQNPYINRDRRFNLTVYYHGRIFNNSRPLEIAVDEVGTPGREAPGYEYRNTRTGYYLRKWMSTKENMLFDPLTLNALTDFHQHALLRRSEVYFNLAEALNEAFGPTGTVEGSPLTAVSIMNTVRAAAGITSTVYVSEVAAQGKEAFRKLILNERRIEFAFENMRYFDLRRWLLPLNVSVRGVKITQTNNNIVYQGTNPTEKGIEIEKRLMDDEKYYYSPIPYEEVLKNSSLIQNKGW